MSAPEQVSVPQPMPDEAVETPRHRRFRHRRRKKFWKRPSWWATVGKGIMLTMLGMAMLFCMWLVYSGFLTHP